MNNKKSNRITFFFCFLLVISPIFFSEIVPWFFTPDGYEYSPVNSFAFRRNDTYFYASLFREICDSGYIFNSPSSNKILSSDISQYSYFFTSNAFISIGCLLNFDLRLGFIFAFITGFLISFIFLNKIFFIFIKDKNFSYFLSLIFILYSKPIFQDIPFLIINLDIIFYLKNIFLNYLNPIEMDSSNQLLRFFNFSHHVIFFLIMIYYSVIFFIKKKNKHFIKLFILSSFTLFQYPPLALINFLFIYLNYFYYKFWQEKKLLKSFILLSIFLILIYIPTGLFSSYINSFIENDVSDHFKNSSLIFPTNLKYYFNFIFNKYVIFSIILFLLTQKNNKISNFIKSLITIIFIFLIFKFIPNNNFEKFFYRGLDFILIIFLLIILFNLNFFKKKFFMIFIILALITSFNLYITSKNIIQSKNRYIDEEIYNVLKNVENKYSDTKIILTNDWNIIDLIPFYTNHYVFYGHKILNIRDSNEELEYYLVGNLILGKDKSSILRDIKLSQKTFINRENKATTDFYNPPFVNNLELNRMNIIEGVLYAHYVKNIKNIKILNHNKTDVSKEFLDYVEKKIDKIFLEDNQKKLHFDLIILNKNIFNENQNIIPLGKNILKTKNFEVYEKKK